MTVVEKRSISMLRIEFHGISSGEDLEIERVCKSSSVATARSERGHSSRTASSIC